MGSVKEVFKDLSDNFVGKEAYIKYWGARAVTNDEDYFRRWLFAFCSVHTTWESNCRAYLALRDFDKWKNDRAELCRLLITSRAGLHNNRTTYIWSFTEDFWSNTTEFYKGEHEPWSTLRNRLAKRIKGLGLAKTSFALEMSFPLEAKVTCLDVHMLRLYGLTKYNGRAPQPLYEATETDWSGRSQTLGVPPYIARCAYWDRVQKQPDSRYWSKVLE